MCPWFPGGRNRRTLGSLCFMLVMMMMMTEDIPWTRILQSKHEGLWIEGRKELGNERRRYDESALLHVGPTCLSLSILNDSFQSLRRWLIHCECVNSLWVDCSITKEQNQLHGTIRRWRREMCLERSQSVVARRWWLDAGWQIHTHWVTRSCSHVSAT